MSRDVMQFARYRHFEVAFCLDLQSKSFLKWGEKNYYKI